MKLPRISAPRIFISYRREDSGGHADQLYERLARAFGKNKIFMDIKNREPGKEFERLITRELQEREHVVAVIGSDWLVSKDGKSRILNDGDFVRFELSTALRSGRKIWPVLVDGATMPPRQALPDDIAAIAGIEAEEVRRKDFELDTARLIREIDPRVETRRALVAFALSVSVLFVYLVDAWVSPLVDRPLVTLGDWISPPSKPPGMLLVTFDDDAFEASGGLGPGSKSRRHHARVLDVATEGRARAVVFGMSFSKPSATPGSDEILARSIERAVGAGTRVVVAGSQFVGRPRKDQGPVVVPALQSRVRVGSMLLGQNGSHPEGVPIVVRDKAKKVISLSVAFLAVYDVEEDQVRVIDDQQPIVIAGPAPLLRASWSRHPISEQKPLESEDLVVGLIFRLSPRQSWRDDWRVSYEDVRAGAIPARAFAGKIVLIGQTHKGSHKLPPTIPLLGQRYAVEIHADAIAALLDERRIVHRIDESFLPLIMAAMTLLGWHLPGRGGRWRSARVVITVPLLLVLAATSAYVSTPVLVGVASPASAFVMAFLVRERLVRRYGS